MKKPYVFISYASKEADAANLVYSYLEGNGTNCGQHPEKFTKEDVLHWLGEADKLSTDMGYDLFERIISHNHVHRSVIDEKITGKPKFVEIGCV